jgi:hypothetical protein
MTTSAPTASVSVLTIDTAPLDLDALSKVGRFQLRRLAEALSDKGIPICDTDVKKQAFMQQKVPDMAAEVFTALKAYREGQGMEVPKATKQPVTRLAQPPVEAPLETAEDTGGVALRTPEEGVKEVVQEAIKPARAPRVAKADPDFTQVSSKPVVSDEALEEARALYRQSLEQLGKGFHDFASILLARSATFEEKFAHLENKLNILIGMMANLSDKVDGTQSAADIIRAGAEFGKDVPFILGENEKLEGDLDE